LSGSLIETKRKYDDVLENNKGEFYAIRSEALDHRLSKYINPATLSAKFAAKHSLWTGRGRFPAFRRVATRARNEAYQFREIDDDAFRIVPNSCGIPLSTNPWQANQSRLVVNRPSLIRLEYRIPWKRNWSLHVEAWDNDFQGDPIHF